MSRIKRMPARQPDVTRTTPARPRRENHVALYVKVPGRTSAPLTTPTTPLTTRGGNVRGTMRSSTPGWNTRRRASDGTCRQAAGHRVGSQDAICDPEGSPGGERLRHRRPPVVPPAAWPVLPRLEEARGCCSAVGSMPSDSGYPLSNLCSCADSLLRSCCTATLYAGPHPKSR